MSLFPTGSGHAGAVERSEGRFEIFLPLPLDISDPFVKDTMTDRVPTKILGRTVKYNEKSLPRESLEAIDSLAEEMRSNKPISPLTHCPRYEEWNEYLGQYLTRGASWNDLPWYVSETYVYHRLLEATGYFKVGSQGHEFDVFAAEKKEALEQALPQVDVRMQTCMQAKGQWSFTFFKSLLHMSLWGNQGDSSLFTAQDMSSKGTSDVEKSRLIVDDSSLSFFVLGCKDDPVVHIFNDNSGMELVSDLAFAHYVVSSKPASTVVLQLKPYPFFVSDATVRDVHFTIETLKQSNNANQRQVAADLQQYIKEGRIVLRGDGDLNYFLASPKPMWEMPPDVRDSLAAVDLVVCKGDLMYRKLLGDRTWNTKELFEDIISYFPCPVTALRTCKAPLAIGVEDEARKKLDKASSSWMVNGEYGMIQFCFPPVLHDLQVSGTMIRVDFDEEASINRMQEICKR